MNGKRRHERTPSRSATCFNRAQPCRRRKREAPVPSKRTDGFTASSKKEKRRKGEGEGKDESEEELFLRVTALGALPFTTIWASSSMRAFAPERKRKEKGRGKREGNEKAWEVWCRRRRWSARSSLFQPGPMRGKRKSEEKGGEAFARGLLLEGGKKIRDREEPSDPSLQRQSGRSERGGKKRRRGRGLRE